MMDRKILHKFSSFLQSPKKLDLLQQRFRRAKPKLKSNGNISPFIFTEIYQCAKIGKVALHSFVLHHPNTPIHIFGTPADFSAIPPHPSFTFHDLSKERQILENFNSGHLGIASLWAKLILERKERYLIHFDSDVVFRGEVFGELTKRLHEGYSLVGPIRNYQHNPNNRENVRYLADVTQTMCFGFDREKITTRSYKTLTKMCQGMYNPYGDPTIDFFDPVMFDILHNGGTCYFLPQDEFGGCTIYGKHSGKYTELNTMMDFGDKLAHFAAVGSGLYYITNKEKISKKVAETYVTYAKEKYAVFCKIFYNEDVGITYDARKYDAIFKVNDWYNTKQHTKG